MVRFDKSSAALFAYHLFSSCMKWLVFSKEELILSYIVLVNLKESPLFRNRLNYTRVNVGAKVEPPTA